MRTTIDAAGRIVVPKVLRQQLQLRAGQRLDICAVDGALEITVELTDAEVDEQDGLPVIRLAEEPEEALTAEQVRDVLEQVRR